MTVPGSSVTRKMSAVVFSCRTGRSPERRRDAGDARQSEIGPEQAGADHAVMRHDDQPVDLLVGIIGEREHRPVGVGFARAHFDAAHDAVGAGRGGDLDAVGFGFLHVGGGGEIDGRRRRAARSPLRRRAPAAPPATRRRARTGVLRSAARSIQIPRPRRCQSCCYCGPADGEICKPIHPKPGCAATMRRFRGPHGLRRVPASLAAGKRSKVFSTG